jgi:hypothetical protein
VPYAGGARFNYNGDSEEPPKNRTLERAVAHPALMSLPETQEVSSAKRIAPASEQHGATAALLRWPRVDYASPRVVVQLIPIRS